MKKILIAALLFALSCAPSFAQNALGTIGPGPIPGCPLSGCTYTGTVTFADAGTWASTGVTVAANGANSVAPLLMSGTINTSGTATTNFPALFIQPTGTAAVTTWSTSGTGLGMNLASGFAGNFIDFRVAGGASVFDVTSGGTATANALNAATNIASTSNAGQFQLRNGNTILSSPASAVLQSGAADAASPVAQSFQPQSIVTGTAATAGQNWTFNTSSPTGTGTVGLLNIASAFSGISTSGTVTFTNSSASIGWTAQPTSVGQMGQLTTTGTLPTNFALATTYYVISTNYATNTISLAATPGGSAIVAGSAGSGVHTFTTQTTVQMPRSTVASFGPSTVTGSQTTPALAINQTWNTSGAATGLQVNITNTASSSGLPINILVNGGSILSQTASGALSVTSAGGIRLNSGTNNVLDMSYVTAGFTTLATGTVGFSSSSTNITLANTDTVMTRGGVATLRLGPADAASQSAYSLIGPSIAAGNTNVAAPTLTIAGGKSNGSGGGDVVFQTTLSSAASGTQNTLATALTLKGGTQAAVFSGVINAANLSTSSAGTTGTVCWTTGTGLFNVDTTTTCLLSLEELKDIRGPISGAEALSDVLALKPFWGSWKKNTPEYAGDKAEQPFLGAHQVASVDKRLAAYAPNGALHGVRYQELTAVLVGAIQALHTEIAILWLSVLALAGWNLWLTFRRTA